MAGPLDPRLLKRATATRGFLVAVAATGIVGACCIIVQAWLIAQAVSGVFYAGSIDFDGPLAGFSSYLWALAGVFCLRAGLSWLNSWLAHRASASVKSQLRTDLMAARLARPLDASTPSSTLIHLATQGLDALDGYFSKYLPQLVMAAFIPLLIWVVILRQDTESAIIIAITIPLIPFFMALIGVTTRDQVNRRLKYQTRLANHFADLVTGLPTLQVFGRARAQLRGLRETEGRSRTETMKTLRIAFLSGGVLELLATLSVALVAVTVGFRVVAGELDLTTALFVLVLAPEAYLPVRMVGVHFHDSADGTAAADAVFKVIESSLEAEAEVVVPPDLGSAEICFDQVSVQYPGTDRPSLDNLSFTMRPGDVLALIGRSGGGKSTALSVLMGFVAPTSGTVRIGGLDLARIDLDQWRRQIAWVGQNPGMLRGTIASNLRLGYDQASDDQLREALDRAGGSELALDRTIADDGEGLSAGERRRVALARALLRIELGGAKLLVLDEPTAGLDQATEAQAVAAVRAAGVGAIVVSHREALLKLADEMVAVGEVTHGADA
ncbi:thiol reductant ABC exporter subunit CydD [Propionimicrobium sp. PCR01-08-3]|uniref:thiol reductant ABC exporter subunit CydD n=1 Tax=Propionimicrobium sp. PCR01-08-3 TaxID=3052086 RepID=UPI00255D0E01|nr:thiol reductant ABC exporter subunit CydD [Propionimicrobium sp. PCR01-08-3]WIY82353.1 thiol reductant ABC exporter subunit CydD [Propionimicrobium sp. PCR01-08-3]